MQLFGQIRRFEILKWHEKHQKYENGRVGKQMTRAENGKRKCVEPKMVSKCVESKMSTNFSLLMRIFNNSRQRVVVLSKVMEIIRIGRIWFRIWSSTNCRQLLEWFDSTLISPLAVHGRKMCGYASANNTFAMPHCAIYGLNTLDWSIQCQMSSIWTRGEHTLNV